MVAQSVPLCHLYLDGDKTSQNYSAGATIPWDAIFVQSGFDYDVCTANGQLLIPAAYAGYSLMAWASIFVQNAGAGIPFVQVLHKDACGATKDFAYKYCYTAGTDQNEDALLLSVADIAVGDYVNVFFDAGDDTSVTLLGDAAPASTLVTTCQFMVWVTPPLIKS